MVRFFLWLGLFLALSSTAFAQRFAPNIYQTQSIMLKPSKAGVLINGVFYAHGKFYRDLATVLRGEEALAALEVASRNKRESLLWFAGSGVLLVGASSLVLFSPLAAGAGLLLSIVTSQRYVTKEMAASDGLHEAIWLHNLQVLEEVVRQ